MTDVDWDETMPLPETPRDISNREGLKLVARVDRLERELDAIVEIALKYGNIDGGHHKQYALDQILRLALGDDYKDIIETEFQGDWDEGIAP